MSVTDAALFCWTFILLCVAEMSEEILSDPEIDGMLLPDEIIEISDTESKNDKTN